MQFLHAKRKTKLQLNFPCETTIISFGTKIIGIYDIRIISISFSVQYISAISEPCHELMVLISLCLFIACWVILHEFFVVC